MLLPAVGNATSVEPYVITALFPSRVGKVHALA